MKKLYKIFLFAILGVLVLNACSSSAKKETTPTVSVSIVPQQFFVNQIAGSWINVNVMVPPGGSPATYEPTPKQMKDLSNSQAYFRIGHITFEHSWMDKLSSVNADMKVFDTSKGLDLIQEEEFGAGHDHGHSHGDHHHHHGFNPHIWLSPTLVKHQAEIIYNELVNLYPEHADSMAINFANFNKKLDEVKLELDEKLKTADGTSFIVYHPVWSYLAKDYGLMQIAIEHNGKEATPDKIKNIVDFANENDIHIIFVQREFSDAQAKSIAAEINGQVRLMNPLDYNWFNTMKEFGETFYEIHQ